MSPPDSPEDAAILEEAVALRRDLTAHGARTIAETEDSAALMRQLAQANPDLLPHLAEILNILGELYGLQGRYQDAVAPGQEAAALWRRIAAADPARQPDLGQALNGLAATCTEAGRFSDAAAAAAEATALWRPLAAADPARRPGLALALSNLAAAATGAGLFPDAAAAAQEAITIWRPLAATDGGQLRGAAQAFSRLAAACTGAGRTADAVAAAEEAVARFRGIAAGDPVHLPGLAQALHGLGDACRQAAAPDRAERAWAEAIAEMAPGAAGFLLVQRAAAAPAGHPAAVAWLADALAVDPGAPRLLELAHAASQRHRRADPAGFDARWTERSRRPAPAWLAVDPALLRTVVRWLETPTFRAEHAYLTAHPELLDDDADLAVAEVLREVGGTSADRYAMLRLAARQTDIDAAYRPVLAAALAAEFAAAGPEAQRVMLAVRHPDLLDDEVIEVLLPRLDDDDEPASRAVGLLMVARVTDPEPVLDALIEPELFPPLLQALASEARPLSLVGTALVALTAVTDNSARATVLFYYAIGLARQDDPEGAARMARNAGALDPAQVPGWIKTLAAIRPRRSPARALIPVLKSRLI
jgi:tetratricopeptide (TPR) repeat protein